MCSCKILRKHYLLVLASVIFSVSTIIAQDITKLGLDELLDQVERTKGREKIDYYNEISFRYIYKDTDQALSYADSACSLASKLKYLVGQGDCNNRKGVIFMKLGRYENAVDALVKAKNIRLSIKDWNGSMGICNNLGLFYANQKKYEEAVNIFEEGLFLAPLDSLTHSKYSKERANILNNLGSVYSKMGMLDEAVVHIKESIKLKQQRKDILAIAKSELNLANVYIALGNDTLAKSLTLKALQVFEQKQNLKLQAASWNNLGTANLELNHKDEAKSAFEKALSLSSHLDRLNLGHIHRNLAGIYIGEDADSLAYHHLLSAETIFRELADKDELTRLHFEKGKYFRLIESIDSAKYYFDSYVNYNFKGVESGMIPGVSKNLLTAILDLSELYTSKDDYKSAFELENQYNGIVNRLAKNEKETVNANFNELLKAKVAKEIELEKEKIRRKNTNIIWGVIACFLLLGGIFFINQQQQQRRLAESDKALSEQKSAVLERDAALNKSKLEQALQEKRLSNLYTHLTSTEKVRREFAGFLHNDLGAEVSYVKTILSKERKNGHSKSFQEGLDHLDRIVGKMRNLSQKMSVLKVLNIQSELNAFIDSVKVGSEVEVELRIHNFDQKINLEIELQLYYIIRELVSERIERTDLNKISIQLNNFGEEINILIEDDGEFKKVVKNKIGPSSSVTEELLDVKARVHGLNGRLNIDKHTNKGKTFIIDIPFDREIVSEA